MKRAQYSSTVWGVFEADTGLKHSTTVMTRALAEEGLLNEDAENPGNYAIGYRHPDQAYWTLEEQEQ